jgi:hypothetical protein
MLSVAFEKRLAKEAHEAERARKRQRAEVAFGAR